MESDIKKAIEDFIVRYQEILDSGKKSIIYAEDNKITQSLFIRVLKKFEDKLDFVGVESSRLVMEQITLKRFDPILLDVQLGTGKTGIECCKDIRVFQKENKQEPSRVVIVSSNSGYEEPAYAASADFFLTKDAGYRMDSIVDVIETLLGIKLR